MLGARHPPPLNDLTRLDPVRKLVGIGAVAILLLTFVPVPFVMVSEGRNLTFEALDGSPLAENRTVALGATISISFTLNNTGAVREQVAVTAKEYNLGAIRFVIVFTSFQIGSIQTNVSSDTIPALSLAAGQRVVLVLNVTAPPQWTGPLPSDYLHLPVRATTLDGLVARETTIVLQVITP
ncbi:MAG TPA: hypothetical protein VEL81_06250, partial [Thermoplasmata archaeon]|nr:hypothetical protein [Thermoplasmata archaeon]